LSESAKLMADYSSRCRATQASPQARLFAEDVCCTLTLVTR
jgi:hypothetical protein